jgi:hypothetical protein
VPTHYRVQPGDCIQSIAAEFGFAPDTVWDHGDNAELRALRKNPDLLMPGDTVVVPEKRIKTHDGATGKRHLFRRRGVPAKLRLRILGPLLCLPKAAPPPDPAAELVEGPRPGDPEQGPLADAAYRISVDGGPWRTGKTDADGFLEMSIPPRARRAELVLEPDTERERSIALELGGLDPIATESGVRQRLANLGFPAGSSGAAELDRALSSFQATHELAVTGELDEPTRARLLEIHGH